MENWKQFLVLSYNSSNKKIGIENGISLQLILELAKRSFSLEDLEHFHLTYFDIDVDEWIDLDSGSIEGLQTQKVVKVKLEVKKKEGLCNEINEDNPRKPENYGSHKETSEDASAVISSPKASTSTAMSASMSSDNKDTTNNSAPRRKPWPKIYSIPVDHIPRDVRNKLTDGAVLDSADKRRLLDVIYSDASRHIGGLYPTSEMYNSMVDALLRAYPKTMQSSGLPLHTIRTYLKDRIIFKFGNSRRRVDSTEPEVQQKKRKKSSDTSDQSNMEGTSLIWGLANFMPALPTSEDEISQKLHIEWLKREFSKTEKDMVAVNQKMTLTFATRRKQILTEMALADVLNTYPLMSNRSQILLEFERLGPNTEKKNIEVLLKDGLEKYSKVICSAVMKRRLYGIVKEIADRIKVCRNEEQRKYAQECMALVGLSILFKEKAEKLIRDERETPETINLHIKEDILSRNDNAFELVVEGTTIFQCGSFLDLFSGFLGSIYCFNLAYPKCLDKTLLYIQNVSLGLQDEGNIENRILSVVALVNSELK